MAFPLNNTTCDILHFGSSSPDVPGVSIFLTEDFRRGHEAAIQSTTLNRWTHLAYLGPTVDIRDAYSAPAVGQDGTGSTYDTIYVPSYPGGTPFYVIFVGRRGRGTAADHKRVFLQRLAVPAWPTNNL
jgi:hypothetical protein